MAEPAYFVETRWGGSEDAPPPERLAEIVGELNIGDAEHPDTWFVHAASGWTLRLDEDGYAYLEDDEFSTASHMRGVSRAAGLDLWLRFAESGPDGVRGERWAQGPRVLSDAEIAAYQAESERITLEGDREFFQLLGPEDSTMRCKSDGCSRGRIKYSVLCAAHHFEQLRKRPCPFI
jgi:hypothetical protein